MCNQTVGLVAAEMERQGISTVCLVLLREVAVRVRPPRALAVPYHHGYPLGEPGKAATHLAVLDAALRLLEEEPGPPPILRDFAADRPG